MTMPAELGSGVSPLRANARRPISVENMRQLVDLPRDELSRHWEAIYGSPPPRGIKRPLLERAIAWHLQAKMFGGLSAKTMRELRSLQPVRPRPRPATGDKDGASAPRISSGSRSVRPAAPLRPGTRLVREWQGRTHTVDVTPGGYVWKGELYGSLSAIARKITGARWSGPRFFGL